MEKKGEPSATIPIITLNAYIDDAKNSIGFGIKSIPLLDPRLRGREATIYYDLGRKNFLVVRNIATPGKPKYLLQQGSLMRNTTYYAFEVRADRFLDWCADDEFLYVLYQNGDRVTYACFLASSVQFQYCRDVRGVASDSTINPHPHITLPHKINTPVSTHTRNKPQSGIYSLDPKMSKNLEPDTLASTLLTKHIPKPSFSHSTNYSGESSLMATVNTPASHITTQPDVEEFVVLGHTLCMETMGAISVFSFVGTFMTVKGNRNPVLKVFREVFKDDKTEFKIATYMDETRKTLPKLIKAMLTPEAEMRRTGQEKLLFEDATNTQGESSQSVVTKKNESFELSDFVFIVVHAENDVRIIDGTASERTVRYSTVNQSFKGKEFKYCTNEEMPQFGWACDTAVDGIYMSFGDNLTLAPHPLLANNGELDGSHVLDNQEPKKHNEASLSVNSFAYAPACHDPTKIFVNYPLLILLSDHFHTDDCTHLAIQNKSIDEITYVDTTETLRRERISTLDEDINSHQEPRRKYIHDTIPYKYFFKKSESTLVLAFETHNAIRRHNIRLVLPDKAQFGIDVPDDTHIHSIDICNDYLFAMVYITCKDEQKSICLFRKIDKLVKQVFEAVKTASQIELHQNNYAQKNENHYEEEHPIEYGKEVENQSMQHAEAATSKNILESNDNLKELELDILDYVEANRLYTQVVNQSICVNDFVLGVFGGEYCRPADPRDVSCGKICLFSMMENKDYVFTYKLDPYFLNDCRGQLVTQKMHTDVLMCKQKDPNSVVIIDTKTTRVVSISIPPYLRFNDFKVHPLYLEIYNKSYIALITLRAGIVMNVISYDFEIGQWRDDFEFIQTRIERAIEEDIEPHENETYPTITINNPDKQTVKENNRAGDDPLNSVNDLTNNITRDTNTGEVHGEDVEKDHAKLALTDTAMNFADETQKDADPMSPDIVMANTNNNSTVNGNGNGSDAIHVDESVNDNANNDSQNIDTGAQRGDTLNAADSNRGDPDMPNLMDNNYSDTHEDGYKIHSKQMENMPGLTLYETQVHSNNRAYIKSNPYDLVYKDGMIFSCSPGSNGESDVYILDGEITYKMTIRMIPTLAKKGNRDVFY